MKHRFKSLDGAARRVRELQQQVKRCNDLLYRMDRERVMLAKLAADSPQFYNPLDVVEAKRARDEILKHATL